MKEILWCKVSALFLGIMASGTGTCGKAKHCGEAHVYVEGKRDWGEEEEEMEREEREREPFSPQ